MSETLLYTQGLQYAHDFSTAYSSSVLHDSENLQKEISTLEPLYEALLDTQKLEYSKSEMSSCSTKDRSESSSNESIILDFSKLKPYDLEQVLKSHIFLLVSELENEAEEQGRIRNTDWCQCGDCKPITTYMESLCCQDTMCTSPFCWGWLNLQLNFQKGGMAGPQLLEGVAGKEGVTFFRGCNFHIKNN